jgi:hypothetical protein
MTDPGTLVVASRAARDAMVLGVSRQVALGAVEALPEQASFSDIVVAIATWHWPDDTSD